MEMIDERYSINDLKFDAMRALGYSDFAVDSKGNIFGDNVADANGNPGLPSEEVLAAKMDELKAERLRTTYYRKRATRYPSVGEQLDDLFKQGAFSAEMAARIQAVKDANPKPE